MSNPPAFPTFPIVDSKGEASTYEGTEGMTLRDYIATKALAALIAQKFGDGAPADEVCGVVAITACQFADALLEQLNKL